MTIPSWASDLEPKSKEKGSYLIKKKLSYTNPNPYPPFQVFHEKHVIEHDEEFEFLTVKTNDWVQIITKKDGQFILVEQYRPAWKHYSLEIPAGKIDGNDDPFETAKRELAEETGFKANKWFFVGMSKPITWTSQTAYIFYAEDLEPTYVEPDPEEKIQVKYFSEREITNKILKREITEYPSIGAWTYFQLVKEHNLLEKL